MKHLFILIFIIISFTIKAQNTQIVLVNSNTEVLAKSIALYVSRGYEVKFMVAQSVSLNPYYPSNPDKYNIKGDIIVIMNIKDKPKICSRNFPIILKANES